MHAPNAPTPGSTTRVGVGDQRRVGGEPGVGADVLQRLLRRAQVADPVVEDRDQRPIGSPPLVTARPWCDGTAGALDPHGVAQAAGEALERGLDDVVDVAAGPLA